MGLPAESNKYPNYPVPTTKADQIEEILAVICRLFRSSGITDYHDWAQVMEASVGSEIESYLVSVWKRVTGREAVQTMPSAKPRSPSLFPSPPIETLWGADRGQLELFPVEPFEEMVQVIMLCQLKAHKQPSAGEFLSIVENRLGWQARWHVRGALQKLAEHSLTTHAAWQYLDYLLNSGALNEALRGTGAPKTEVRSGIDSLLRQSVAYRSSAAFQEMVNFMANFRDYAPYNNMLVRVQNPACSFYATEADWKNRFERRVKEDARPMLILAPMHPVMLVYDLDQTDGPPPPEELSQFSRFEGEWKPEWLQRTVRNAIFHDRIRVQFKHLSTTNSGFATLLRETDKWKMRIVVHRELDEKSRYGVLCHELAHIYLGHLGCDKDHWWASRSELNARAVEIEAETVAFIVTTRLGLQGTSAAYVSRYLGRENQLPDSVSLDLIAKAAGRIEEMSQRALPARRPKKTAESEAKLAIAE